MYVQYGKGKAPGNRAGRARMARSRRVCWRHRVRFRQQVQRRAAGGSVEDAGCWRRSLDQERPCGKAHVGRGRHPRAMTCPRGTRMRALPACVTSCRKRGVSSFRHAFMILTRIRPSKSAPPAPVVGVRDLPSSPCQHGCTLMIEQRSVLRLTVGVAGDSVRCGTMHWGSAGQQPGDTFHPLPRFPPNSVRRAVGRNDGDPLCRVACRSPVPGPYRSPTQEHSEETR